jgi:hypothetical protein
MTPLLIIGWALALLIGFVWMRQRWLARRTRERLRTYTSYLEAVPPILERTKTDPQRIYSITFNFMSNALSGGEEEARQAAEQFHAEVAAFSKELTDPLEALSFELRRLRRNCNPTIKQKIKEIERLIQDSKNELDLVLKSISTADNIGDEISKLQTMGYGRRSQFMDDLHKEIKQAMQREVFAQHGKLFEQLKTFAEKL